MTRVRGAPATRGDLGGGGGGGAGARRGRGAEPLKPGLGSNPRGDLACSASPGWRDRKRARAQGGAKKWGAGEVDAVSTALEGGFAAGRSPRTRR